MKRIFLLLAVVAMTALQSCEGDQGPPGPPGPSDGNTISEVFEVTTTFLPSANQQDTYRSYFDLNPAIYTSDVLLVYQLSGTYTSNGQEFDIWKLLPQVYTFDDGGIFQYNYDFSANDFSIFIDANFNVGSLDASWTQNKTFRIVIVPGDFSARPAPGQYSNYYEVIEKYNIDDSNIKILKQK